MIATVAAQWVGKEFRPGVPEQCMAFVRQVLNEAKSPLAQQITSKAVDGLETSFYLASSLAGRDLGTVVDKISALEPGAILFFQDTYGNWPRGTITHVGIYAGNGYMIHRPTMSRPVEKVPLAGYWSSFFRCGLLTTADQVANPKPLPKPPTKIKLFCKPGKMVLVATEDLVLKAGQELQLDMVAMEMVDR